MEFRRKEEEEEQSSQPSSKVFTPLTLPSAFSKPLLPSSSSLLTPKSSKEAATGSRNGTIGSSTQQPDDGSSATRYRECLKNHAASLGGHVVDGCGEFMAAPTDPLKCAACGCHRSFHRRESESESESITDNNPLAPHRSTVNRIPLMLPPPHPNPHHQKPNFSIGFRPPSPLAFGGGGGGNSGGGTTTESSSEEKKEGLVGDDDKNNENNNKNSGNNKRKRFRTKFSSDQKEKMMGFAERVGWRVQKKDEVEMESFCGEIGVSRQVLKVWMHNNKHLVKRPPPPPPPPPAAEAAPPQ